MIPVFKPSYGEEELEALRQVLASGWAGLGPKTREFEQKFARFLGTGRAVGLNSGTAALHLAFKLMNVEGGEVITTPLTFVSTNHAILYNRAVPVFADIEESTLNVDINEVEKLITPRTRAVVAVHFGGHPCRMNPLMELSRKHGFKVVEDCAHACGSEYRGQKAGTIGDAGCFSFHAVKNLACGEGGALTLKNEELDSRARKLRWLGISKDTFSRAGSRSYSWQYDVDELGYKAHMNDIPAVIGLVQLAKLEALNDKRRRIAHFYNQAFADLDWLETPPAGEGIKNATHNYVIKIPSRDRFIDYLGSKGISVGMHYYPNHLFSAYKEYRQALPVAEAVWKRLATLPLYPDLTTDEQNLIVETVRSFQP